MIWIKLSSKLHSFHLKFDTITWSPFIKAIERSLGCVWNVSKSFNPQNPHWHHVFQARFLSPLDRQRVLSRQFQFLCNVSPQKPSARIIDIKNHSICQPFVAQPTSRSFEKSLQSQFHRGMWLATGWYRTTREMTIINYPSYSVSRIFLSLGVNSAALRATKFRQKKSSPRKRAFLLSVQTWNATHWRKF